MFCSYIPVCTDYLPSLISPPDIYKPPSLLYELPVMRLVQGRRIQQLPRRRSIKVNLHMLRIQKAYRSIAKVVSIRKSSIRRPRPDGTQPLDIPRPPRDNIHRRLGIIQARRIRRPVDHGPKALRVVHMPKDAKVHAVPVQERLESVAAGLARLPARRVPGPVAGHDDPRRDGAVDRGEVGLEELQLLVGAAKGSAVEAGGAVGPVGRAGKVGLGVDHDDVRHAVLEGEPEWGLGQLFGLVGIHLGRGVVRRGRERGGHAAAEPGHEVGKVLLAAGAEAREVRNLLAGGLVVARAGHVGLARGDGGELVVELLQDGLEGVLAVKGVVAAEDPVVGVAKVAGVDDEFVLVDGVGEALDGGVVERGRDVGDLVSLCLVHLDGVAVLAVDAEVDDGID